MADLLQLGCACLIYFDSGSLIPSLVNISIQKQFSFLNHEPKTVCALKEILSVQLFKKITFLLQFKLICV